MTHPRQLIRHAIADAIDGIASRVRPTADAELPCRLVYTLQEEASQVTIKAQLKRDLTVVVEVRRAATAGFDDDFDADAEAIEAAIAADPTLGGKAANATLVETAITLDDKPETPQAVGRLAYRVSYFG